MQDELKRSGFVQDLANINLWSMRRMGQAADPLSNYGSKNCRCGRGRFLGTPGKTTDAESIAASDPDVIVMAWCGAGDRVPLERTVEKRGWGHLKAGAQWPCLLYFRRIVEYACAYAG